MRIAVIGSRGQLGKDLCSVLSKEDVIPLTHRDIEITRIESVRDVLQRYKPEVVINTAAFVRVDDCEDMPEMAFAVNAEGARNVALVSQEINARLVHISTDYVFGGERRLELVPYREDDVPVPLNIYGRSKLAGEEYVRGSCERFFIVRVAALFGTAGSSGKGGNFIETILRLGKERDEIRVVNDQKFSPTSALDAARKIAELLKTEHYGIVHVTNKGDCTWYDFALEILNVAGLETRIVPVSSAEFPQKAVRPRYSVLGHYRLQELGMDDLPPWQDALKEYFRLKGYLK